MNKVHRELLLWVKDAFAGQGVLDKVRYGRHMVLYLSHAPTGGKKVLPMGGPRNYRDARSILNFKADMRQWVECLEKEKTMRDKKDPATR